VKVKNEMPSGKLALVAAMRIPKIQFKLSTANVVYLKKPRHITFATIAAVTISLAVFFAERAIAKPQK